ncbi:hypothetical protein DICVIV_09001 [Dictyocaulus viviparus]|uniref:ABC transmembrane type-1 domain-containing protein n=1 Tax=Dictyocaulus viviparus TaxID=29172 RepID=A0A0D8XMD2_DICVI|nr:hypothetical protein DICVIV_09001 [Dictyocaulus viviparus]
MKQNDIAIFEYLKLKFISVELINHLNLAFRNVSQIEDGIGDKMGLLARGVATFISSATFAFVFNWRITLVCVGVGPVSVITMAIMSRVKYFCIYQKFIILQLAVLDQYGYLSSSAMQGMMNVSGEAEALAEESIMNVKTVSACNGQDHMVKKYDKQLRNGRFFAIQYNFINGFFEGFMFFQLYVFYAAAFLYVSQYF